MPSALAYGLMGAAQGALQGLKTQNEQDAADARFDKLMQARALEAQQLEALKAQYQSAANLQKIQAQFGADTQLEGFKAQNAQALQTQKDVADAQKAADDRAAREKVAGIGAGATLGAAKIRADAIKAAQDKRNASKPRGTLIVNTGGKNVVVGPNDPMPAKGSIVYATSGTVRPPSLMDSFGLGDPTADPSASQPDTPTLQWQTTPPPAPPAAAAPPASTLTVPPQAAAYLKANPTLAPMFDLKYGTGASKRILGQ